MTASRAALLLVSVVLLVILILSGNRLSSGFRERFLSVFPRGQQEAQDAKKPGTPTPTPISFDALATSAPLPATPPVTGTTKGGVQGTTDTKPPTKAGQIPATGPETLVLASLAGTLLTGILLQRKTR